ncbi:MAG: TRAP transporter small permease [Thermodesulfobacteriota bacterium]
MLDRINKFVGWILNGVIAVVHGVIVVVLFAGVVTRFVFNAPLFWGEEVCILALVWMTFLGGAVLVRQDKHVTITILADLMPPRVQNGLRVFSHFLAVIILAVMVWQGFKLTERLSLSSTPALRLNEGWFAGALVTGFIVMLFYQVQRLIGRWRGREVLPHEGTRGEERREP